MLDQRIAELIQADVDGELPASERAELESVLERSEEARQFRDEMVRIARLMAEIPDVDPPAGLASRILSRIELPARSHWFRGSVTWLQPASYGLAVAAGVLIAVGITRLPSTGPDDISELELVGSMVRHGAQLPHAVSSQLTIALPGVDGNMVLKDLDGQGRTWAIEFEFNSGGAVELRVDLASAGLGFSGVADPSAGLESIEVSGGEVRMMSEGRHQFVIFLRRPEGSGAGSEPIGITMSRDGEVVFRGSLEYGESGG